ncbi:hypothetical protein LMG19144_00698 [Xanthomonas arboricola pv. fragariae]|nr:hypothetical protein LMG19144_00698 [Xanthomonas arboricola pv. fragariae]
MRLVPSTSQPDLRIDLAYSARQTPFDLAFMLYAGASALSNPEFHSRLRSGQLGPLLVARIPIVTRIHDALCANVAMGMSRITIKNAIRSMRNLFAWCDETGRQITHETARDDFWAWSEHLLRRATITRDISYTTAYGYVRNADAPMSRALQLAGSLRKQTRMRRNRARTNVLGPRADKQSLEDAFAFGRALHNIISALTYDVILGDLPVGIRLHNGVVLTEWSWSPPGSASQPSADPTGHSDESASAGAVALQARGPLINLRIEAELLTFIAQTGMNLTQAYRLRQGQFKHVRTHDDLVSYRINKRRRGGEAEFHVYRAYRPYFEAYLSWRERIAAPGDTRLFPFLQFGEAPAIDSVRGFDSVRNRMRRAGLPWVGPQKLRRIRVNWLLRRSESTSITALMVQHKETTLVSVYEQPNHHLASAEVTKFQRAIDPSLPSAGPGACIRPLGGVVVSESAGSTPLPDCVSPSGCLFCTFHRDLDSEDYVWSLVTLRFLKRLELHRYAPSTALKSSAPPAEHVIDRIGAKLKALAETNEVRALWVRESESRVREGRYHAAWDGFIQCMER